MNVIPTLIPIPCPDCGVDLQRGLIEIRTGVTTTHTWRANRFFKPGEWYLALDEADGAETLRWVCAACGVQLAEDFALHLAEDFALHLGKVIYGAA